MNPRLRLIIVIIIVLIIIGIVSAILLPSIKDLGKVKCFNPPTEGLTPITMSYGDEVGYRNEEGQLFVYTESMLERCDE